MNETVVTVSDVLATANNTFNGLNTMVTIYLAIFTILLGIFSLIIQWYLSQDRKKKLEEAVNNIVNDFGKNENLRDGLIKLIMEDEKFKERFNSLIDISVNDKLDHKVENYMDKNNLWDTKVTEW